MKEPIPAYLQRTYRKGDHVRVLNADPCDQIRGIHDGAIGEIVEPERRDGKPKDGRVYRCPLVKFGEQELWMGMHQLEPA